LFFLKPASASLFYLHRHIFIFIKVSV